MCRSCINIERAKCDPFIERQADGRVWSANRIRAQGRFADRVWPVFRNAHIKRKRLPKPSEYLCYRAKGQRVDQQGGGIVRGEALDTDEPVAGIRDARRGCTFSKAAPPPHA